MDKAFSLRKKRSNRPKISAPQQVSAPQAKGSSSTADYVKRRYSTYNSTYNAHAGRAAKGDEPPPVPSLPKVEASRGPSGGRVRIDPEALANSSLSAEQYVTQVLGNANDEEIKDYQSQLARLTDHNDAEIKQSVYENRERFIKINEEARTIREEIGNLRDYFSDIAGIIRQQNAQQGIGRHGEAIPKRSSVASLQTMYASQMTEFHRRVDGSKKYLPYHPARHILYESRLWYELNSATLRSPKNVHLILLSDHLVVAAEKLPAEVAAAQANDSSGRQGEVVATLYTKHCLPLQGLEISDISQYRHKALGNRDEKPLDAIRLQFKNELYTLAARGSAPTEKATFMEHFHKAAADLRFNASLKDDSTTLASTSSNRSLALSGLTAVAPASLKSTLLVDVDGKQHNFKYVQDLVWQLDYDIAMQRWEAAVGLVEQLRRIAKANKTHTLVQKLDEGQVQQLVNKMVRWLLRSFDETSNAWLNTVKEKVSWLTRLGFENRAALSYLTSRTATIKWRVKGTPFLGNLDKYMWQVCFLYFEGIKNTVKVFQASFAPPLGTTCVKWAKEMMDDFNEILRRETSRLVKGSEEWRRCIEQAQEMGARLSEVGYDFRHLIGEGIDLT